MIDAGSNTLLLLVLEATGQVVLERAAIARLGEGVFATGRLLEDARVRTRRIIGDFVRLAREAGARSIVVVGTAALRRAADGADFLGLLRDEFGIDEARLLSPVEEAEMALEAARRNLDTEAPSRALVVVDVGGGSTEVAWAASAGAAAPAYRSFEIGSVSLTEAWLRGDPPPPSQIGALRSEIDRVLSPLRSAGIPPSPDLVAVAGTATTLAAMELSLADYDAERVEGMRLGAVLLARWIERLAPLSREARCRVPGLESGRADVIVAGLCVLERVLEVAGVREFRVSGRGVRFGVALRLLDAQRGV